MKLYVRNGFIVAEGKGLPKNVIGVEAFRKEVGETEFAFLEKVRKGDWDKGIPCVDLWNGTFKLSYRPYYMYNELYHVSQAAQDYGIELDESFLDLKKMLGQEYARLFKKCEQDYKERMTLIAEDRWQEKVAREHPRCNCDDCLYCADVIDGDLWCRKYHKDLDFDPSGKTLPDGRHLMFASVGKMLDECKREQERKQAEEKARFIDGYVNGYDMWMVEDMVINEMNKGDLSYV